MKVNLALPEVVVDTILQKTSVPMYNFKVLLLAELVWVKQWLTSSIAFGPIKRPGIVIEIKSVSAVVPVTDTATPD